VNARVQVEHPVTEAVSGIDIVREQIRIAQGLPLSFSQEDVSITGHAIECRINAENSRNNFLPNPGLIEEWTMPQGTGIRVDTYAHNGAHVPPYYDSLIAKIIVHAPDRRQAVDLMARALAKATVRGVDTTIDLQLDIMRNETFRTQPITTKWLEESFLPARPAA